MPRNRAALESIRKATRMQIETGGGLRSEAAVAELFDLGVDYAILGTSAVRDRELLGRLIERWGDRIIVGIDARDGLVAVEGWVETSELSQLDFARDLEAAGVATVIATDIATDGMMTGPNLASLAELARATTMKIIASGGVRGLDDLKATRALGHANIIGSITGRAVYEEKLDVAEAVEFFKDDSA